MTTDRPPAVGDWIALGCSDGSCPVGAVFRNTPVRVTVKLKSSITGGLMDRYSTVRWADVAEYAVAYSDPAHRYRIDGQHLTDFQLRWMSKFSNDNNTEETHNA